MSELRLTPGTLRQYLADYKLVNGSERLAIDELGGGVSNVVLRVKIPQGDWVAKQSLGKLRVEDDWRSSRERIFREAMAIELLQPVLGDALPQVIHVDRENYLYIMTAAPAASVMWKQWLLDGQVQSGIAQAAGRLLATMIRASQSDPIFAKQFADRKVFDELRIDPYYRTTAARHPDVREAIERLIKDSWQIRTALVHGDYSPKNMLVHKENIFLIDFEVVHWGDPAFDAAFLLNHLMLKSFYRPANADLYFQAARQFWKALSDGVAGAAGESFERMTVWHLGGLMLARVDGKSPVEYIQDDATKACVRRVAKHILLEAPGSLAEAWAHIQKGIAGK